MSVSLLCEVLTAKFVLGNMQCFTKIGSSLSLQYFLHLFTTGKVEAMLGVYGVTNAHFQGGMVGDLSCMQPEFIQSFLAGLAASGVFLWE
ncbi:solute carrier family 29 [Vigna unguiculata]|uniref:Solute carrier family 29 n=1 Tax=Vigna unguiculata TaxID=3917 RepID=A0A4D6NED6_VIGUN|nr:solute carrier family 29 [Vigna unguiculata]